MDLNKLFGSQAKVDIFKYLTFKRDGVSMRALESELDRTFPAIKKQIDSLDASEIIDINKDNQAREIIIKHDVKPHIRGFLLFSLQKDLEKLISSYEMILERRYKGQLFGNDIQPDLVIIHRNADQQQIDQMKQDISILCRSYFIDQISMTFMSANERDKRYRLADRFVLTIMRAVKDES